MMKLWICVCFLVLALSSLSRGQNNVTVPQHGTDPKENADPPDLMTPPPLTPGETEKEANSSTAPSTPPQSHTSANTADGLPTGTVTTNQETTPTTDEDLYIINEEVDDSTAAQTTTGLPGSGRKGDDAGVTKAVPTATTSTSTNPDRVKPSQSWGYVILVIIILVIIALCVILYFLRRVSRTYSFDLQRPAPANHLNEPIGTFEPVYLDDLAPKDQVTTDDLSPPPVANGTTLQSEEKGSNGENAPQEQPDANGVETSLTSHSGPSPGDDPAGQTSSPVNGADLLFDAAEEEPPQNENNNNNPSVCSGDPFVEINLDDPGWCDQFLASPDAPSSVLPFSPFSSSSSSS